MEKGKAREWWVDDITGRICGPWKEVADMSWPDYEKVIHVREVIPLTDDEKRRVEEIRRDARNGMFSHPTIALHLISLLERAGVI